MVDIGAKLRKVRRDADLTQQQLADRMKVSRTLIAVIETGDYIPGVKVLERVAKALNVSVSVFFEDKPTTREAYYKLENEEIDFLDKFRMLSPAKRQALIEEMEHFLSFQTEPPKRRKRVNGSLTVGGNFFANNGDNYVAGA